MPSPSNAQALMALPRKTHVLLRDATVVLVLNTVAALCVSLFVLSTAPQLEPSRRTPVLVSNLVFAQAIGFSIFGLIEGARLTWWWRRRPPVAQLWVVTALAIVLGYLGGGTLASALTHADHTVLMQFGPAGFLVGAVTLATSVFALHILTQRELLSEERRRADSARLQLLQQQIEPHMLFNTIANVHALIDEKPADAQRMLEALGELLHASMQLNEQPLVSLKQEFALLRHYLELMSIRMGPRLAYSLVLPPELEEVRVPPLSVQPLVENAVKHGLEPSVSGGTVAISARTEGKALIVEVVDSGLGFETDGPAGGSRIGLSNVRKRLAYAFGERASLHLRKNHPSGVVASLTLPR